MFLPLLIFNDQRNILDEKKHNRVTVYEQDKNLKFDETGKLWSHEDSISKFVEFGGHYVYWK